MVSKFKDVGSFTKHVIIFLFFLNNYGLVIRGFTLECYINEEMACCSGRNLTEVPKDIPPNVKHVDLSRNTLSKIQMIHFKDFPVVKTLDLQENTISYIGEGAFSNLVSLQELKLNTNKMVHVVDGVFSGLSNLRKLFIGNNQIKTVAFNAFKSLTRLEVLDLSNNKLGCITKVHLIIQHMPRLNTLQIKNNNITAFKSQDLTNSSIKITYLDLSENPIDTFQITADVFPKLTSLDIGSSAKVKMAWDVQKRTMLAHVTTLDVSGVRLASDEWRFFFSTFNSSLVFLKLNSIHRPTTLINISCSIPTLSKLQVQKSNISFLRWNSLQFCQNVTEINLERNNIKLIYNDSFAALQRLQMLSLSYNKLRFVPYATRNLQQLTKLDLSFNSIGTLRCQDFANLTNLKQLNLQRNRISALSKCTFWNLSKLEELKLQENVIAELDGAFQTRLPNLNKLHLKQNKLTIILRGEFSGLQSLMYLSLSQNLIQTLEKGCFSSLKRLKFLQLEINKLKSEGLNEDCFKDLVNLRKLNLGNNHIKYWSNSSLKNPPFLYLSRLENLIVSVQRSKGKGLLPSNFLQGLTSLTSFICINIQLSAFPHDFFTHTPRLTTLDISGSHLTDVSPFLFSPIPSLTSLGISELNLRALDFLIDSNLTKLTLLRARQNAFSVISEDVIKAVPSLLELDLKLNSFMCACDNYWFVQWVQNNNRTQVIDAYSFTCNYPPHCRNSTLLHLNVHSCVVDIGFLCFISTTCPIVLMIVASFTYHFLRWQLTYAYHIFWAWLFHTKKMKKRAACQYDAFVSYNSHDEAWVYGELLPHLEQQQGWRLCLHHRDFLPGKAIVENIADAIYGSRKTIGVISRRYLQSEWCSREMQVASFRLFDEREDVLILVFLEDIPTSQLSPYYRMRKVLKRQTYLSWPRAGDNTNLFWENLRQAMRSTNTEAEDRLLLTVTETP